MAARFPAPTLDDFHRAFDELFDDLLIQRWRTTQAGGESQHAIVRDYGDRYEVRIATGGADASDIDIEVSARRLTVRVSNEASGMSDGSVSFSEPVEPDRVTAKAAEGTLAIVLPKMRRTRRVRLEQS